MTIQQKIITYKCNTCNRTKDYEASNLHSFINLCSITLNCQGRLFPIATKSLRNVLASASVDNVPDWISRFEQVSSINTTVEVSSQTGKEDYVNLSSSTDLSLSLAIKRPSSLPLSNPNALSLAFATQQTESSSFEEYTYFVSSSFNTVSGPDSTSFKKVLRFTSSDIVKVFVNGVELSEGFESSEFRLVYNGNNGYKVTFNTTYTTSSTVKVVVFQNQSIVLSHPVYFTKNTLLVSDTDQQTAWSNVSSLDIDGDTYDVYSCPSSEILLLPVNQILNLYPEGNHFSSNVLEPINLSDFKFLLAYPPFYSVDRVYSAFVSLNDLSDLDKNVRLFLNNGILTLQVSKSAISYLQSSVFTHFIDGNLEWLPSALPYTLTDEHNTLIGNNPTIIGPI